ncbi:SDR family NAD(P)-dependent oxidoreductase [Bacillus suaedae]|uniref:SDR family oxidoreductase n=1 Tax=Halalkalibacter suaedae TaxID=2822140 RepID=A0A940WXJ1_9BACI|nr:SDR family oxidoreductase [Bacillus suaedae]MBP3952502.1 SDR family oxidoreductase [Bacillus suaedae]
MNQTVLLTGASSGIGYELAKIFAENRYDLILVARSQEKLEQIKVELSKPGIEIITIVKDLSISETPFEVYEELKERGTKVDILINNAGYGMSGQFVDLALDDQLNMMQLNMISLTTLTHLFVQDMVKNKFGRIMNVGSVASFFSVPNMSVYGASKAFVLSFSESLNTELKHKGDIKVTALCPGPTKTNFAEVAKVKSVEQFNRSGMTAKDVALSGYKAMLKGEPVVVPGFTFKVAARSMQLLPRKWLQSLIGRVNH